jgi:hypothetical protein
MVSGKKQGDGLAKQDNRSRIFIFFLGAFFAASPQKTGLSASIPRPPAKPDLPSLLSKAYPLP